MMQPHGILWKFASLGVVLILCGPLPAVAGGVAADAEAIQAPVDEPTPSPATDAAAGSEDQPASGPLAPLGRFLAKLHNPIDNFFDALPLWVGTVAAVSLFIIAGIWVWSLRKAFIYRGAPDMARWRDLRIWATLLLVPYIAVYLIFR